MCVFGVRVQSVIATERHIEVHDWAGRFGCQVLDCKVVGVRPALIVHGASVGATVQVVITPSCHIECNALKLSVTAGKGVNIGFPGAIWTIADPFVFGRTGKGPGSEEFVSADVLVDVFNLNDEALRNTFAVFILNNNQDVVRGLLLEIGLLFKLQELIALDLKVKSGVPPQTETHVRQSRFLVFRGQPANDQAVCIFCDARA